MRWLCVFFVVLLGGCATVQGNSDPYEQQNRETLHLNDAVEAVILRPVIRVYQVVVPSFVRSMVGNFLSNLTEPLVAFSALLQGNGALFSHAMGRFMTNSILGLGGLFDPATSAGTLRESSDLGVTLAKWGVPQGPYMVLPLLGPFTVRSFVGFVLGGFSDPLHLGVSSSSYRTATIARKLSEISDGLDDYLRLKRTSVDFYATLRSLYMQHRRGLLQGAGVLSSASSSSQLDIPDFDDEDDQ